MKLLVDIGNTRIKWARIESSPIESHSFNRSKTGVKASLNSHWKSLEGITSVHVSNVAGDKIAQQLTEWVEKQWKITPVFVQSEKKRFGVTNSYEQAELLGVDRWLALIAARQHARQATCVIDCGTAITADIVTKYGAHQGGMILPGLTLMREALTNNTSDLNETDESSDFRTLAVNTQSAIKAGTLYSVTATLDRIVDDLKEQYNNRIRFIITGGDAELLKPLLPPFIAHYPDIVLKGLAYYARQGERKPKPQETVKVVEAVEV
ncbi:MAG: type III pantothenate kinase, partial [Gammaproteobacteria bacterium]|nr:type III pantothenate kinase [Gammaproteobacteria bacterium]